jgi:uncharacterized protein YegP (UPF0339 family)
MSALFRIELYKSRQFVGRQKWRWRAIADNGNRLANGGEAYANQADAAQAITTLFGDGVPVDVVT